MVRKVVVDVDAGSDDALALMLLLLLEKKYDYKVIAITCTHGNTTLECVCSNVLRVLWTIDRLDVPVFRGAKRAIVSLENPRVKMLYFHGLDGFGDNDFPTLPESVVTQTENAVVALERIASENKGIYLICLGPLTNLALAVRVFPEFRNNVKALYIMGGNVKGVGNICSSAEFNFYLDPEAAHIVLSTMTCPVNILPWESCKVTGVMTTQWRFETLGNIKSPQIQLLNTVERKLYDSYTFWNPCDAFLTAAFMDKTMIERTKPEHMSIELHGIHTRGQAVIDHLQNNPPNVTIIKEISLEFFQKLLLEMAHTNFSQKTEDS